MVYRVIGLMSGSSLDGLDIAYTELEETGGKWTFEIKAATCVPYNEKWVHQLQYAAYLSAYDYLLLHTAYGKFIAEKVKEFIASNNLHHKVQLIASHGHTVFHTPHLGMTSQLGDGATIAALSGVNVVSDLRAIDVALGGEGAPIVPIGEKLLLSNYGYYLNLGGIANISTGRTPDYVAYDVCPANRVLNMLVAKEGKAYDDKGEIAKKGTVSTPLLEQLNTLDYYKKDYPKSLSNDFGTQVVFPLINSFQLSTQDALRTYTEHIIQQIVNALNQFEHLLPDTLLVTGGGAFNTFLVNKLQDAISNFNIEVIIPDNNLIQYKEALVMALIGVLRWREENTVISSVTGAGRSSIGCAVWIGQEA